MAASFFLIFVAALFVLLLLLIFLVKGYRSWIYITFNVIFALLILTICFFAVKTSRQTHPFSIKTTNYSKKKGELFFFAGKGCNAVIRYGYPVSNNEASRMELDTAANSLGTVIFLTGDDQIYKVPNPDFQEGKLDIWDKELIEADQCFREQIKEHRNAQYFYSFAIGLLLFGLLLLFIYRKKRKEDSVGGIVR